MELKTLDKRVLMLWYVRAAIVSLGLVSILVSAAVILSVAEASRDVALAVWLGVGIPVVLLLGLLWLWPTLRYKMYAWGYDDRRIVVKQGVIFRQRVVIPVCQIQDLHRIQGPFMTLLHLSDVTISTAGSNFNISTLTADEADRLVDTLERHLETRIEERKYEEI